VQVGGRIVLQYDADMLVAVHVLVYGSDPCDLVREEQILGVGPP
jgi:hypothetical protein